MALRKCLYCSQKYEQKPSLYTHMVKEHEDSLPSDISVARHYFNVRNKRTEGTCMVCKSATQWNEASERYDSFCSDPCKEIYVKDMKQRMVKKYGKEHLLNDDKTQRKMLKGRSISGTYEWSDGIGKIDYVGSYELDFLKFMDHFLGWSANDIMECPFVFEYIYEGKKLKYIPDFYIPSLRLVVELKEGGKNPNTHEKIQAVDKVKEKLKDEVMQKQTLYNYIKITDKNYGIFLEMLLELKNVDFTVDEKDFKPVYMLGESINIIMDNMKKRIGI